MRAFAVLFCVAGTSATPNFLDPATTTCTTKVTTALTTGAGVCSFVGVSFDTFAAANSGVERCDDCSTSKAVDDYLTAQPLTGCSSNCLASYLTLLCRYDCERLSSNRYTQLCVDDLQTVFNECQSCLSDPPPATLDAWLTTINAHSAISISAVPSAQCTTPQNFLSGRSDIRYSADSASPALIPSSTSTPTAVTWTFQESTAFDPTTRKPTFTAATVNPHTANWVQASKLYAAIAKVKLSEQTTQPPISAVMTFLFPDGTAAHTVPVTSSQFVKDTDGRFTFSNEHSPFTVSPTTPTGTYNLKIEVRNTHGTYDSSQASYTGENDACTSICADPLLECRNSKCQRANQLPVTTATPDMSGANLCTADPTPAWIATPHGTPGDYTGSNVYTVNNAAAHSVRCCGTSTQVGTLYKPITCTLQAGTQSTLSLNGATLQGFDTTSPQGDMQADGFVVKLDSTLTDSARVIMAGAKINSQAKDADLTALGLSNPTPLLDLRGASFTLANNGQLTLVHGGLRADSAAAQLLLTAATARLLLQGDTSLHGAGGTAAGYAAQGFPLIAGGVSCASGEVILQDNNHRTQVGGAYGRLNIAATSATDRCSVKRATTAVTSPLRLLSEYTGDTMVVRSSHSGTSTTARQDPTVDSIGIDVNRGSLRIDSLFTGEVSTALAALHAWPFVTAAIAVEKKLQINSASRKAHVVAGDASMVCCGAHCGRTLTVGGTSADSEGTVYFGKLESGVSVVANTRYECKIPLNYLAITETHHPAGKTDYVLNTHEHVAAIGFESGSDLHAQDSITQNMIPLLASELQKPTAAVAPKLDVKSKGKLVFSDVTPTYSPVYVHGTILIQGAIEVSLGSGIPDTAFDAVLILFRTGTQDCAGIPFGTLTVTSGGTNRAVTLECKSFSTNTPAAGAAPTGNNQTWDALHTGSSPFDTKIAQRLLTPGQRGAASSTTPGTSDLNEGYAAVLLKVKAVVPTSTTASTSSQVNTVFTSTQSYTVRFTNAAYSTATAFKSYVERTFPFPAGSGITVLSLSQVAGTRRNTQYQATYRVNSPNGVSAADTTAANLQRALQSGQLPDLGQVSITPNQPADPKEADDDSNEALFGLFGLLLIPVIVCVVIALVVQSKNRKADHQYMQDTAAFSTVASNGAQPINYPTPYYAANGAPTYTAAPVYDAQPTYTAPTYSAV